MEALTEHYRFVESCLGFSLQLYLLLHFTFVDEVALKFLELGEGYLDFTSTVLA